MTYQERNIVVSLVSNLLFLGYYAINVYNMTQNGGLNSTGVFSLWGTVIVLGIVITIVSTILAHVASSIFTMITTHEEPSFIEDERDKLIHLKGTRNAYVVFAVGVLISMGTLVMNMSPLVMFLLLIFSGIGSAIFGDLSRLYFSRRGV